jgi:hypothetical protein
MEEEIEIGEIKIDFYWPYNRFALGWDIIKPDKVFNYTTIKLYLLFITITYNY